MAELLIEHMPFSFRLEESSDGTGKIVARGQFARSDKPTSNKRLYREHLWRREINKLNESMRQRRAFGELDHPQDGRTKLQRVSHLITNLKIEGNEVVGEAEVLDTPNGRILKALVQADAQVGVSSRGYGSVKALPDGTQEVQEDFRLDTFDFVADPATSTAYPSIFTEERQHIKEAMEGLTLDALKTYYPGLMQAFRDEVLTEGSSAGLDVARVVEEAERRTESRLKTEFSTNLRREMEVLHEAAYNEARSELLSDPEVAEAKAICERVYGLVKSFGGDSDGSSQAEMDELRTKVADKELEAQKHESEAKEAKKLAKIAAYQLHLERRASQFASRKTIVELVGDVLQFEDKDALDRRIDTVIEELRERGVDVEQSSEETESKLKEHEAELSELRSMIDAKNEELKDARSETREAQRQARRAVDVAEALQVELHVERRLNEDNPHANQVRTLCEGATSIEQVDRKLDSFQPSTGRDLDEDEAQRIRARLAKQKADSGNGGGQERSLMEDTFGGKKPNGSSANGQSGLLGQFGLTEDKFDRLAGIKPD